MRGIKLAKNAMASLLYQVTTIICGFVLPRWILGGYGSEVNGLVNSISQFLGIMAFLELGIGAVIMSSLYQPLAEKDSQGISQIVSSANKFFRRLAFILLIYIFILFFSYPYITNQSYDIIYTGTLIVVMSISSFAQYYFGIVDQLLLSADQRSYVYLIIQTMTVVLNTVACVFLISIGCSIHIVKLVTSGIFLLRPFFMRYYVNRHYEINRCAVYEQEPIQQKWNGLGQHIAIIVVNSSGTVILSILSSLAAVSVYSIYHLVVSGVEKIVLTFTTGFPSAMGELWAKRDEKRLIYFFDWTEWILHTGTVFVFGCAGMLIVPFVQVYTAGINDANYIQPLFAIIYVVAISGHCLRQPYHMMILAAGHYRQTQHCYIITAAINVLVSIATVRKFGLVGISVGTLLSVIYQTVWMAWYNAQNLVERPFKNFAKQILADVMTVIVASIVSSVFQLAEINYIAWIFLAVQVALTWLAVIIIVNFMFYRDKLMQLVQGAKQVAFKVRK